MTSREVVPQWKTERPKKKRRQIPEKVRAEVRARSRGRCEVVLENGDRCQFEGQQMHHIRRRSQGGEDIASNLVHVDLEHHGLIHANPAWAIARGYLAATEADRA